MAHLNLGMLSRSTMYIVHGHREKEARNLPISPNTLQFMNKGIENDLKESLYTNPDTGGLSEEYKHRLKHFYGFMIFYYVIKVVSNYIYSMQGTITDGMYYGTLAINTVTVIFEIICF